jgi:hypothetical protein
MPLWLWLQLSEEAATAIRVTEFSTSIKEKQMADYNGKPTQTNAAHTWIDDAATAFFQNAPSNLVIGKRHVVPTPLYAVSIHHCIAHGDLPRMKALAAEAEKYGDVSAALGALKAEIAKLEADR